MSSLEKSADSERILVNPVLRRQVGPIVSRRSKSEVRRHVRWASRPSTTTIRKEIVLESSFNRSHKARDMKSWLWFAVQTCPNGRRQSPRTNQGKTMTKTRSLDTPRLTQLNLLTPPASRKARKRNTRRLRLSPLEPLEARCCLAAVAFAHSRYCDSARRRILRSSGGPGRRRRSRCANRELRIGTWYRLVREHGRPGQVWKPTSSSLRRIAEPYSCSRRTWTGTRISMSLSASGRQARVV